MWRGDTYASGKIENARIDVAKLGREPLPLEGGDLDDIASSSEPYESPDPYASLWNELTAKPRPSFEFDGIAWGALPGLKRTRIQRATPRSSRKQATTKARLISAWRCSARSSGASTRTRISARGPLPDVKAALKPCGRRGLHPRRDGEYDERP
jgi:hypothetical protein